MQSRAYWPKKLDQIAQLFIHQGSSRTVWRICSRMMRANFARRSNAAFFTAPSFMPSRAPIAAYSSASTPDVSDARKARNSSVRSAHAFARRSKAVSKTSRAQRRSKASSGASCSDSTRPQTESNSCSEIERLTSAALGRLRAIALVVQPAGKGSEQESAKASLARLHKAQKIAADQMRKKSLHILRRRRRDRARAAARKHKAVASKCAPIARAPALPRAFHLCGLQRPRSTLFPEKADQKKGDSVRARPSRT